MLQLLENWSLIFYERQVLWIIGYFKNVKFLTFRHFTIIKNISQLNVRHAFQASHPSTLVQLFPKLDMHSSIQKTRYFDTIFFPPLSYNRLNLIYLHGESVLIGFRA